MDTWCGVCKDRPSIIHCRCGTFRSLEARHADQILAHQDDCDNGDEETIEVLEHPISGETLHPSLDKIPIELAQSEDSAIRDNEVVLHTPHKENKRYPERTIKPPVRFSP